MILQLLVLVRIADEINKMEKAETDSSVCDRNAIRCGPLIFNATLVFHYAESRKPAIAKTCTEMIEHIRIIERHFRRRGKGL